MHLRKILILILCNLFFITSTFADPILRDTNGRSVDLAKLKNTWIVIAYWAGWCGSCMKEMPELNRFYKDNHDKNVLLFGVSFDQMSLPNLKQVMAESNIHFPVLADDPNAIWALGDINAVPTTFIINPEGNVVKTIVGPSTEGSLAETLRELQKQAA